MGHLHVTAAGDTNTSEGILVHPTLSNKRIDESRELLHKDKPTNHGSLRSSELGHHHLNNDAPGGTEDIDFDEFGRSLQDCWGDGTFCDVIEDIPGPGSCENCCNKPASFWPDRLYWACGQMPCWGTNTRCLAGSTCNSCCNGYRWVWEWFGDHCNWKEREKQISLIQVNWMVDVSGFNWIQCCCGSFPWRLLNVSSYSKIKGCILKSKYTILINHCYN